MLQLYSKENCHLCDAAIEELERARQSYGIEYHVIDINSKDCLMEKYGLMIPVVEYEGEIIQYGRIDSAILHKFLKSINKVI